MTGIARSGEPLYADPYTRIAWLHEEADRLRKLLARAAWVAEHLYAMIDRETWRATGGDDGQGHYEGDYRADELQQEIESWKVPSDPSRLDLRPGSSAEEQRSSKPTVAGSTPAPGAPRCPDCGLPGPNECWCGEHDDGPCENTARHFAHAWHDQDGKRHWCVGAIGDGRNE